MAIFISFNWSKVAIKIDRLKRKWQKKLSMNDNSIVNYNHSFNEMPDYLRFNQWILTGYRPTNLSTFDCIRSICSLHNETINIMTHTIPILYIIINYESMFARHLFRSNLAYCHLISCLTSWIGSICYHVFMNHRKGRKLYSRLLMLDVFGIWITQTFGALTTINASLKEFPELWRQQLVIFYLLLSLFVLYNGIRAKRAWQRSISFILLVLVRVLCFLIRIKTHNQKQLFNESINNKMNDHNQTIININSQNSNINNIYIHVIGQELWPIIGAIISVLRIPERYFPGKFDLFLNSHNIMHFLVVLGGFHMHMAFLNDIQYLL